MSTLLRITLAALLAIAIAALAIHAATRTDTVQRWLGREVATALGPGVRVGIVDVSLLPPPKVRLREARIEAPSDQRTIIEVADLGLDVDIGELVLERQIRVRGVSVDDAVVHVDLRSERIGESLDVLAALFGGGAAAKQEDAKSPSPAPRALDVPAEAKSVTVLVQPADERAKPVRLDFPHLRAIARRAAGDPTLTVDLDAELANGSLVVAIVSERREAGRAIEADFRASDLTLAEIFAETPADFRRASLEGKLRREAGSSRLTGGGTLRLSDGVVSAASLGAALWKAMFGLLPGAGGAAAAALVRSQPTVLESLSTRFALREHRIDLRDLQLGADDYFVTGDGSVGFDSTLSMDLQVQLTPAGLTKMLLVADLPVKRLPVKSLPPIPLRVSGTTRDPIVRASIDSLPSGILDYGTGTAGKVTKGVLDAARGLLQKGADLLNGD